MQSGFSRSNATAAIVRSFGQSRSLLPVLIVAELVAAFLLALYGTGQPQCCDAEGYSKEATALSTRGLLPGSLSAQHNYLYPAFIALLRAAGIDGRIGIGIAQVMLLALSAVLVAIVIGRVFRTERWTVFLPILLGTILLPAAAWSGYWLSEALAAPVLLLVLCFWIAIAEIVAFRSLPTTLLIMLAFGLVSGAAWMVRPALMWVPAIGGLLAFAAAALYRTGDLTPRLATAALVGFAFAFGLVLVALPQLVISGDVQSALKLDLARAQSAWAPAMWRYATNLSGCGPPALAFSPLTDDAAAILKRTVTIPVSFAWSADAAIAHLVSGWDALPSPTYATKLSLNPWVLVTLVSGFFIVSPFVGLRRAFDRSGSPVSTVRHRDVFVALFIFFTIAETLLLFTATEFRFNVAGWLTGGVCLALLVGLRVVDRASIVRVVMLASIVGLLVFVVGQMTMHMSDIWIACAY